MVDSFNFLARFLFVLNCEIDVIEADALLDSLLSMALLSNLGMRKRLPLRLSRFSFKTDESDFGICFLSHLHMNLDSCMANSSSSFRILQFLSLVRVCCLYGPMFFQLLLKAFSRGLMSLGLAPPPYSQAIQEVAADKTLINYFS